MSNLHCVNNMKNGSAEDSGIHLAFFFFACVCSSIMRLCACSEYLAAVHCKDLSNVLQEKTLPFGWACVHVLV